MFVSGALPLTPAVFPHAKSVALVWCKLIMRFFLSYFAVFFFSALAAFSQAAKTTRLSLEDLGF